MKTINLTRGKVVMVDDEDFELLSKFKWHAMPCKSNIWYAARTFRTKAGPRIELMHKVIRPDFKKVDHHALACVS